MSSLTVSIMTPVYNAAGYLAEAIESVLAQTYPHWNLVVVDDGSTDGSRAVAERYPDARIQVYSQTNAGEASARNTALTYSTGDLLAFVDADDRLLPEHLALTVAYLDAHPEMDGVYSDGYHIDPQGMRMQTLSSRRRGPFTGDLFEQLVRASDVFGPPMCVVLRRGRVAAGGFTFDPDIVIGPDWDFFTRFSENARFGYLPDRTCEYRIHTSNITVQTGMARRRGYLARCREKAIHLARFETCSAETRTAVFYDLLIELLSGQPERQAEVVKWPQFNGLPAANRARLLRLMASQALLDDIPGAWCGEWLDQAAQLQPDHTQGRILKRLYDIHPDLLRAVLRMRRMLRPETRDRAPFADIHLPDA